MSRSDTLLADLVALRPSLVRYLTRYTGDRDLAEDLAQDAFVRLQERPPADDRAPRAWLFTVATNLARDHGRVARRRRHLMLGARDRVVADPPRDPATAAELDDLTRRVRRVLDRVSEKERTALLLREEGFTHREIADAVGTTTQSVGTLLARALTRVGAYLEKELDR